MPVRAGPGGSSTAPASMSEPGEAMGASLPVVSAQRRDRHYRAGKEAWRPPISGQAGRMMPVLETALLVVALVGPPQALELGEDRIRVEALLAAAAGAMVVGLL